MGTTVLIAPILVYRYLISPLIGPRCRFAPSCSEYAVEALKLHGPVRGTALAARRLARCHPFTRLPGGWAFDPVPPRTGHTCCRNEGDTVPHETGTEDRNRLHPAAPAPKTRAPELS
nr:membrane protein insertion efficiency factor YidD [Futiania mangrovii]